MDVDIELDTDVIAVVTAASNDAVPDGAGKGEEKNDFEN